MNGLLGLLLAQQGYSDGFQWQLIALCWLAVFASLVILVVRSVQRARKLSDQVPEEERRWM